MVRPPYGTSSANGLGHFSPTSWSHSLSLSRSLTTFQLHWLFSILEYSYQIDAILMKNLNYSRAFLPYDSAAQWRWWWKKNNILNASAHIITHTHFQNGRVSKYEHGASQYDAPLLYMIHYNLLNNKLSKKKKKFHLLTLTDEKKDKQVFGKYVCVCVFAHSNLMVKDFSWCVVCAHPSLGHKKYIIQPTKCSIVTDDVIPKV